MQYICRKKASFGGQTYYAGDIVPAEKVDPARGKQLIGYGLLSAVDAPEPPAETPAPMDQPASAQNQPAQDAPGGQDREESAKQGKSADKPGTEKPAGKKGKP